MFGALDTWLELTELKGYKDFYVIEIYLMLIGIWPEFVSQNSIKELWKIICIK